MIDAAAQVQKLLRQQAALARFGSLALRERELTKILTEAARVCAEGLNVPFSKVCQYRVQENDLLIVAGYGWQDGVIGNVVSRADMSSPQGRAFTTGLPSIIDNLQKDAGFDPPPFYAAHGIVSIIDVIIKGNDDQPYGILEIDNDKQHDYDQYDINFLTGFANVLAEAVSTASRGTALQVTVDLMKSLVEEKDRMLDEKSAADLQLRQAQKMEAVGQLTGGIAHDLNNILTVITGTIEILAEAVADRPELVAIAKMIDEAAGRGADLTQRLLAFARKQPLQPREVDVNALVSEAAKLLRPTLGEQIEIHTVLAGDASHALIDPSQLKNAILNLALNARDAMADGGKLTIETGNVVLDDSYASVNSRSHRRQLRHDRGNRYRARHSRRHPEQGVRTILHHQGRRQGHPASASAWCMDSSSSPTAISRSTAKRATARRSRSICRKRQVRRGQLDGGEHAIHRRRRRDHTGRRGRRSGADLRARPDSKPGIRHAPGGQCDRGFGDYRWSREHRPDVHRHDHAGLDERPPARRRSADSAGLR